MNPTKNRRLAVNNTTGYTGVCKSGKNFKAEVQIDRKQQYLGTYETAKEAAVAYDRVGIRHKFLASKLNFPDGLPCMNPTKKRRLASTNTSGYTGVCKSGKKFKAAIKIDGKKKYLGTHVTPKEAALAYDRAVVQHKRPSSKLNFPNNAENDGSSGSSGSSNSSVPVHPHPTNATGYMGVTKQKTRFQARIRLRGKKRSLGTHATAKEAARAFDRAVIKHKLPSTKLNFPNDYTTTIDSEDDESSDEESDNDSCHSSDDDDESDNDDTVLEPPPPSPQARPHFERDPMLDRLFAEQNTPF